MPIRCLLLLLCAFTWACGDSSTGPLEERIVEGVNFTQLFASPSREEINAIFVEWSARDLTVHDSEVVLRAPFSLIPSNTPATIRIIAHRIDGERHYGAVIAPDGAAPASLPVLVYNHPGSNGVDVQEIILLTLTIGADSDKYIYVLPSFRAEALTFESTTYHSEGRSSPWDRDVDDSLVLLDAALSLTPEADPDRIGVVGMSRGATVGLLMAVRDPRIDLVVDFFGPTDFFADFVQEALADAFAGREFQVTGFDVLDDLIGRPLRSGELTLEQARLEFLRRSPVYFADRLPPLQLHHGLDDAIVPAEQSQRLADALRSRDHEAHFYPGGRHNPLSLSGSTERMATFLQRLLNSVVVSR